MDKLNVFEKRKKGDNVRKKFEDKAFIKKGSSTLISNLKNHFYVFERCNLSFGL